MRADGTLCWGERQCGARDLHLGLRDGLRLIGFRVRSLRGTTGRGVERELRPWQFSVRRLLIIQVTLSLPACIQLDDVIPYGASRAKSRHGRSAGACG